MHLSASMFMYAGVCTCAYVCESLYSPCVCVHVHVCVPVCVWVFESGWVEWVLGKGEVLGGDLTAMGGERKRHCQLILKKHLGSRELQSTHNHHRWSQSEWSMTLSCSTPGDCFQLVIFSFNVDFRLCFAYYLLSWEWMAQEKRREIYNMKRVLMPVLSLSSFYSSPTVQGCSAQMNVTIFSLIWVPRIFFASLRLLFKVLNQWDLDCLLTTSVQRSEVPLIVKNARCVQPSFPGVPDTSELPFTMRLWKLLACLLLVVKC